jgi:heterodisulfide reductase subunit B
MKLGFYPGCSLKGTAREYNESVKALAPVFGIELEDIEDWNCCGASAAHADEQGLIGGSPGTRVGTG